MTKCAVEWDFFLQATTSSLVTLPPAKALIKHCMRCRPLHSACRSFSSCLTIFCSVTYAFILSKKHSAYASQASFVWTARLQEAPSIWSCRLLHSAFLWKYCLSLILHFF